MKKLTNEKLRERLWNLHHNFTAHHVGHREKTAGLKALNADLLAALTDIRDHCRTREDAGGWVWRSIGERAQKAIDSAAIAKVEKETM